jgi:integrase
MAISIFARNSSPESAHVVTHGRACMWALSDSRDLFFGGSTTGAVPMPVFVPASTGGRTMSRGTIYKRGQTWWIKYYRNGKPYRESSHSRKEADARRLLNKRMGEIVDGRLPGIYFDRVRFEDLVRGFLTDYRLNQRKSMSRAERSVKQLDSWFSGMRVSEITSDKIEGYILKRMKAKAASATINRELAALKRMLNLGAQCTPPKVDRVPHIPMLKENNVRKGFFEHGEFVAVRDALPEYLKGLVTFAYKTGWRSSEITHLQWSQVDLKQGVVRLEPGTTKNDQGRTVYLDSELAELFHKQGQSRKHSGKLTPYVFTNKQGTDRIKDFRDAWERACKTAGVGAKLFHDFRRTAVRNMVRAGVPERVAMLVSGHKTRAVFDRYNIVSDDDLRMAAAKQEAYLEAQMGTVTGTVANFKPKRNLG